jgi:hypothetical protein
MRRRNEKQLPGMAYLAIGISIMLVVFRYLFWSELSLEMDIFSCMFPGYTLGYIIGWWSKK